MRRTEDSSSHFSTKWVSLSSPPKATATDPYRDRFSRLVSIRFSYITLCIVDSLLWSERPNVLSPLPSFYYSHGDVTKRPSCQASKS